MPWAEIILAAISLTENLLARAQQSGELTTEQSNQLLLTAMTTFAKYATAPPPPPSPVASGGA